MKITFSEGSGLNDSVYGKCQAPIRMFLEQRGEQFEQQSVLKDLFLMGKSENYGDLMTTMTAMSGFEPVGENGAYPMDGMQEGYQKLLVYDTWKDSFSISAEMMEDSKVLDMKKQPAAFMTSYNRTRELFGLWARWRPPCTCSGVTTTRSWTWPLTPSSSRKWLG